MSDSERFVPEGYSEVVAKVEFTIMDLISEDTVTLNDLLTMLGNMIARLRLVMTLEEVHGYLHVALMSVEKNFEEGTAFMKPDGSRDLDVLTAEQKLSLGMERNAPSHIEAPDFVPDDLL